MTGARSLADRARYFRGARRLVLQEGRRAGTEQRGGRRSQSISNRPLLNPSPYRRGLFSFRAVDRLPVQFAQVVDGGVELPLAAAALEAAHTEAVGTLPVFHLPEHGFDRGPALAVEGTAAFGAQFAVHALTGRHGPRHPPTRGFCNGPSVVNPSLALSDRRALASVRGRREAAT